MSQQLERDVRFLKRYAIVTTTLMVAVSAMAFVRPARHEAVEKFTEIDVERINVMEPDGKYRLVISNRPRSIGPIYKGKPFGYAGGGRPGLIFFNDEGTENGGLTFTGTRGADGRYRASTHMSFDQFDQDQVLNLDYTDNNGRRLTGFSINDRADINIYEWVKQRDTLAERFKTDTAGMNKAMNDWLAARAKGVPLTAQRMFVGRDPQKNAVLNLSDPTGKPRLRLLVDSLGAARIEFLDASGKVTNTIAGK
ncbi:MAG: hypothetical protein JF602_09610 [Gemmatimonadetes bacterium]|jgi:hypothetical protein|nr:hypothetical protein [Gemmatimonadota bacterium]